MSVRRRLIQAADRPLGRPALAAASTWYARRRSGLDVQILHDRAWVHRIGSTYVPVSEHFEFRREWEGALDSILDPIADSWFFYYTPRPGDTIVDVGAGDGLDSLVFSRAVGSGGRVLAVEAHPATFVLLESTCRLNDLANVICCQRAVMDRAGTVTMVEEGSHRDLYAIATDGADSDAGTEVLASTLDALCREHDVARVDFLKMNIEGAERQAIEGARETLSRTHHVCIACHDFLADDGDPAFATKAFVSESLREQGFEVVRRDDHPLPWVRDHVHGVRRTA